MAIWLSDHHLLSSQMEACRLLITEGQTQETQMAGAVRSIFSAPLHVRFPFTQRDAQNREPQT